MTVRGLILNVYFIIGESVDYQVSWDKLFLTTYVGGTIYESDLEET